MLEKIIEQAILQAPAVGALLYIMAGQDKRINDLMAIVLECLKSRENESEDKNHLNPQ